MSMHSWMMMKKQTGSASSNLLLDDLSVQPVVALSLRKLDKDYSGSCIRVRRSSDNTESDIGFTSGGDLDESALTTFTGSGDGFIVTWYDQSPADKDFTNSTTTEQPRIVSAGTVDKINSKPSAYFSTDILNRSTAYTFSSSDAALSSTLAIVLSFRGAPSTYAGFWKVEGGTDGQGGHFAYQTSGKIASYNGTLISGATTVSNSTQYCWMLHRNGSGTNVTHYLDGASDLSSGSNGTYEDSRTNDTTIGCASSSSSQTHVGSISEVLFFDSALGSTDRTTINNSQTTYW